MKKFVLWLPVLFLLASLDRVAPDRTVPPAEAVVSTWDEAAPTFPGRNEGRFGLPGDPLNLVIVGRREAVRDALRSAGWTEIPTSARGSIRAGLEEFLAGRPVASFPPMNDYRLRGRRQDMNWAMPVRFLQERHHFRLWRTGTVDRSGRDFWWGSANYDLRVRWRDLSHVPDPDANRERDFIVSTIMNSPRQRGILILPAPQVPTEGENDKGYPFKTDGRVAVIDLR
ncbi:MAG: LssY C-terminal domain-containing protein [Elusimicrobia bacterium]|nr:LssY C-terminal domain-containing protein [Elusimicrobiota bacterium]